MIFRQRHQENTFYRKILALSRNGTLDRELGRRYAIEKVYKYIEDNRESWIGDIKDMSKEFTRDSIGGILDFVVMDKNLILGKLSTKPPSPIVDLPPDAGFAPISVRHTGKSISSFWFHGSTYEVNSWRGLLRKLSSVIYSIHTDEFDKVLDMKGKKRPYYTRNKGELVEPMSIPNIDIFVEGNISANRATRICRKLIAAFGYSDEDLKVEVHDGREPDEQPDPSDHAVQDKFVEPYSNMRPVFDVIESKIREFGNDIKLNIRKVHIGFMRNYNFVVLHVTKQTINIGLSLEPSVEHDRLKNSPGWSGWSRLNKSISISSVEDIDDQLVEWLRQSYDRS